MKMDFKITLMVVLMAISIETKAQVAFDSEILDYKGIKLFQDSNDKNAYYYLPQGPKIMAKDSIYKLHFWKYVDVDNRISGGIFSAQINFSLTREEYDQVSKYLSNKNKSLYLKGQLPLFSFKDHPKYGNVDFQLLTHFVNEETESERQKVLTSGHAPIQEGSTATIMIQANAEEASILEQLLRMGTTDLSVMITAYYAEKSPKFNARIAIPTKRVVDMVTKEHPNSVLSKEDIKRMCSDLNRHKYLEVKIFDAEDDNDKTEKVDKLVAERILANMFKPTLDCTQKKSSNVDCYQFIGQPDSPRDSLYIFLEQNGIRRVPIISAGNINIFADPKVKREDYISVIHLRNTFGKMKDLDFGIHENYLEGFQEFINSVHVKIRTDSVATTTQQLSFTWSDIKDGAYRKKISVPHKKEGFFEYKTYWNLAKVDTTLVVPWVRANHPFVLLAPPLKKRDVTIVFDGMNKAQVKTVLVDFKAFLGKKKKSAIIKTVRIKNSGTPYAESFTMFTDRESKLFCRTQKVIKSKGLEAATFQTINDANILMIH